MERCKNWAYSLNEERLAAEAEVARLREFMACADTPLMRDVLAERDEARKDAGTQKERYIEAGKRQLAAEAERDDEREAWKKLLALTEIRAEAAEAERDEAREATAFQAEQHRKWFLKWEAAEAEVARLREVLGKVDSWASSWYGEGEVERIGVLKKIHNTARAALGDDA